MGSSESVDVGESIVLLSTIMSSRWLKVSMFVGRLRWDGH